MRFPSSEGCPQDGVFLPSQMEFYLKDKNLINRRLHNNVNDGVSF
jgi:hypothetical protein